MTKVLRILNDVVDRDLPDIVAYHLPKSRAKAESIVAEYDEIIAAVRQNPRAVRARAHGWRVCIFRTGVYALYYREMPSCWLVGGVFHARRDPDWIQAQLVIREARESR